jgi:ATP-dependent Lon protease
MRFLGAIHPRSRTADLPLVPMRDIVVFPHMIVPFFVGRPRSVKAVEAAMAGDRMLLLAAQRSTETEDPVEGDIHAVGTISKILQMLRLPDGTIRLLAEGLERARIVRYARGAEILRVAVEHIPPSQEPAATEAVTALMRAVHQEFDRFCSLSNKVSSDVVGSGERIESADRLVDMICANVPLKVSQKVELLGMSGAHERLEGLATALVAESKVLEIEHDIHDKVRKKLERSQKEYFLHEQMREIQRELGSDGDEASGVRELEERLKGRKLPEEVATKTARELKRLGRMQPMSPESAVLRTYLEWVSDLPWDEATPDCRDIESARRILDEDHYDLKTVKERILDFIAVRILKGTVKGPILCFVGPPGIGKTSLGRSVARALGRRFVRISLGGVRDEAEIRGHRKTYVGALPGKIVQSMKKAGAVNPVFLLDEVDKMSSDYRGDPASALLEVLDPEQNSTFVDHYLEVPYDLSRVMFITTANSAHNIPHALRDRMEVIEIQGYSELEKVRIAEEFLVRKQREENGLAWASIGFERSALVGLIRGYTMESGVRNLEREIANVLRKIARDAVARGMAAPVPVDTPAAQDGATPAVAAPVEAATGVPAGGVAPFSVTVTEASLEGYLGKPKRTELTYARESKPGLAYGLAWTELGGTLLPVEVAILEGKGRLILTGNMGQVMKESAQASLSFLRAHAAALGIKNDFARHRDIHIHIPEGAIPKDGPSAGITITAALLSAARRVRVAAGHAMTGEITLTGRLLPIGGVKEKVLAAHRHGFSHVLMPSLNTRDTEELPAEVLGALELHYADSVLDALQALLPSSSPAADVSTPEA